MRVVEDELGQSVKTFDSIAQPFKQFPKNISGRGKVRECSLRYSLVVALTKEVLGGITCAGILLLKGKFL